MKMFDVVVYLSSLQKQTPGRKVDTLVAFAEGSRKFGANVRIETKLNFHSAKLAVILGWPSPILTTANIKFRAEIVHRQKKESNHVMSIDANCFKFLDTESKYLRYSINSVEYNIGEYANKNSLPDKWIKLQNDLKINIEDWKVSDDSHLLLVQRDGGWGMKGLDPIRWAKQKINDLRVVSQKNIILRPHPGKVADLSSLLQPGVYLSDSIETPLVEDLKRSGSAFVFNSSSGVASIINGVPLWVDDPSAVCWNVANHSIQTLNNPILPDRSQWLYDLAACHWTDEESRQGLVYQKFLPYLL